MQNELAANNTTDLSNLDDIATIIRFLQRPAVVDKFQLNGSNFVALKPFASMTGLAPQTPIRTYNLPKDIMKVGYKNDKLNNFEWFKADCVLRFMINANPFVAGRIWITFAPVDDQLIQECQINYKSRAAITSYPGVELDLQTNTAAEIRIPWCLQFDALSLTDPSAGSINMCQVYVYALSDLLAGENIAIPVTVMGHFENIELKGPTPRRVNAVFQMAKETKGPITEISSGISKAADLLSEVPVIGGVAKTVGWAANIFSGVASVFGWSRPIKGSTTEPISNTPGRGFTSFKGEDNAVALAMANDNEIGEVSVNFMETVDEMDIQHVCGRPALVATTRWLTNSIDNAVICNLPVAPLVDELRVASWEIGSSVYQVYDMSLFELMATRFAMWRADVHFKISLVKTPYHVGRFEVFYVPGATITDEDARLVDTTNTYRHVFDITEQNEVEFVVPYMHKNVMCRSGLNPLGDGRTTDSDATLGSIVVRALTPLNAPSTVSQAIQINVWKWATNVAFSCPMSMSTEVPPRVAAKFQCDEEAQASGDHITKTIIKVIREIVKAEHQINVQNIPRPAQTIVFGSPNSQETTIDSTSTVAGEMLTNLRQAIKGHRRYELEVRDQTYLNTSISGGIGGYIGLCANIYSFYRGGMSYKIVPNASETDRKFVMTQVVRTEDGRPISVDNPEHLTYTDLNPFHEVQTAFYSASRRGICNFAAAQTGADLASRTIPGVLVRTDASSLRTYVGAKDDMTFGFLLGSPIYGINITPARQ